MIMAKKIQTKKNLKPYLDTRESSKSSSIVNGGRVSNFLKYMFLSPSTAVVLANAISWAEILDRWGSQLWTRLNQRMQLASLDVEGRMGTNI
jgi:hypothetical protein